MVEHIEQGLGEEPVQTPEKIDKKPKKKRSAEQKIGRHKVHELRTNKIFSQNERILDELRWIRQKMDRLGEADYSPSDLEGFAVYQDQVDREIQQKVLEAGDSGVFPKDIAEYVNKLGDFGLRYYDVSRRIVRMNKRLHYETGHYMFEKRGHRWALSKFAFDIYGASESEVQNQLKGASE